MDLIKKKRKKGSGGARPGAGNKSKGLRKKGVTMYLLPEVIELNGGYQSVRAKAEDLFKSK